MNGSKAFIEYSNDMDDVSKNIEEYNPNKKQKILIVFDDIIADMLSNKKLNPILTEIFITERKLNISLVYILLWKFQTKNSLNKLHLIICLILTLKSL